MESASTISVPQSCQTCFRPLAEAGAPLQPQWISVCRCDRPYSPNSQFSIDVCAKCNRRVSIDGSGRVGCLDVCACVQSDPKKVPAFPRQNRADAVTLDLASVGVPADRFPLERFIPLALLGDSARATVVLARDKQRSGKVAVKIFKRLSPALKSTFESEVKKNQQLSHAGIAKISFFGFYNEQTPYIVTEYKDGFNLEQCIGLYGVPSYDVAVKILIGVCEALIYAQTQGVLHRDIRPGNVIFLDDLNAEPTVALTDFALPKIKESEPLTEPRDAFYMSGDEARNLDYDERSELYSIGCIGYLLLTGKHPFQDGTALDIKNAHALKLPPRISSVNFDNKRPKELEEIIDKCLEKDPRERYESVAKLLERLEVFPRREKMKIDAVLAEKRRKQMLRYVGIGLAAAAVCAVGYFVLSMH